MTSQEWAKRHDLSVEYANYQAGRVWEEKAWARSLGFAHAEECHRASDEAFAESVREYGDDE